MQPERDSGKDDDDDGKTSHTIRLSQKEDRPDIYMYTKVEQRKKQDKKPRSNEQKTEDRKTGPSKLPNPISAADKGNKIHIYNT